MSRPARVVLIVVSILFGLAHVASGQSQAYFDYSSSTDLVLIDYSVEFRKIAEEDRSVNIRVFGDGYVELHRPFWQLKSGSYSIQLSPDEVQTLLDELLASGALHFDPMETRTKCLDEDKRRLKNLGQETGISADTWMYLSVRVDGFQRADSASVEGPVDQQIAWRNLEWSSDNYPGIQALKGLRAAARSLDSLWQHQGLTGLEGPGAAVLRSGEQP
ncbi:MAG: hypothetical protein AAGM22_20165 [Acidobacteriota bacterium]